LSNELRSKSARSWIDPAGFRHDDPAKTGFDIETCDVAEIKAWLNDPTIKKSHSLISFVHRICCVRFPDEYARFRDAIKARFKLEHELIQSEAKNEIEWFGETGYHNMVRLDKSVEYTDKLNVVKMQDGRIRFSIKG
jgi:hypothetical protein